MSQRLRTWRDPEADNFWAYGPTGRHQPGVLEIRVRFPVGPLIGDQESEVRGQQAHARCDRIGDRFLIPDS